MRFTVPLVLCTLLCSSGCGRFGFDGGGFDGELDAGGPGGGDGALGSTDADLESPCSLPGAIFCSGFEEQSSPWDGPGGSADIVDGAGRNGGRAFIGRTEDGHLRVAQFPAIASDDVYLRAWIRPNITLGFQQGVRLMGLWNASNNGAFIGYQANFAAVRHDDPSLGVVPAFGGPGVNWPAATWICIELRVDHQATGVQLGISNNDIELATVGPGGPIAEVRELSEVRLGITYFENDPIWPGEIAWDDVVVSTERIPCDAEF